MNVDEIKEESVFLSCEELWPKDTSLCIFLLYMYWRLINYAITWSETKKQNFGWIKKEGTINHKQTWSKTWQTLNIFHRKIIHSLLEIRYIWGTMNNAFTWFKVSFFLLHTVNFAGLEIKITLKKKFSIRWYLKLTSKIKASQ